MRPVINIYMKLTHIIEQPTPPEPPPINMQSLVIKVDEVVGQVFQNPQAADELKEALNDKSNIVHEAADVVAGTNVPLKLINFFNHCLCFSIHNRCLLTNHLVC